MNQVVAVKRIFITGGTTGIGCELAKLYLKSGAIVGVCGRDRAKFEIAFASGQNKPSFYEVDVVDREKLMNAVDDFVRANGGKLDVMIANAGVSMGAKTREPDFCRIQKVIEINVFGVLNAFECAWKHMKGKEGGGHIVAIASVAGFVGLPGSSAYSASKAAVLRLCETFAMDLKEFGIHVTAIAPGFIDTPLTRKNPHPMPFLMTVEKGAQLIYNAIREKKTLYVFPFSMKLVVYLLAWMPRGLYRKLMTFKLFNYSQGGKKNG